MLYLLWLLVLFCGVVVVFGLFSLGVSLVNSVDLYALCLLCCVCLNYCYVIVGYCCCLGLCVV